MFRNYFKLAARNLIRQKGFTVINIAGLAIGLATCLMITLFVKDELSYDRFNKNAARIYRINTDILINGTEFHDRVTPAALGPAMVGEFPGVENMVRLRHEGHILVKAKNETFSESGCFWADSTLFQVFTLPMVEGDPRTALSGPNSLVISESVARKYFKGSALGKTLVINNTGLYKITGVIKDMPPQSHLHFRFIKAMSGLAESQSTYWLANNFDTYLLLRPHTTESELTKALAEVERHYVAPQLRTKVHISLSDIQKRGDHFRYLPVPITRIHLYSDIPTEIQPTGNITYIYLFLIVAGFILIIACVNFTNLYTAYSMGRAREIGVRKILGSGSRALIGQFLTESVLTALISLVLAVVMTALLLPYFNQLSGKTFTIAVFSRPGIILGLLAAGLLTGLVSGIYPAFILSAFDPVTAIKGKATYSLKGSVFKNGLVIFQFVIAIVLIVGTLVIYRQMDFIRHKRLGYDRYQVLVLRNIYSLGSHAKTFKNQVLQIGGVESATMAGVLPTSETFNAEAFSKDPSATAAQTVILGDWEADRDYIPTMGMKIKLGRNFEKDMPTDSNAVIINETAGRILGFLDPLGKTLYRKDRNMQLRTYHIIGVVADFNTGSLRRRITPVVMELADNHALLAIRVRTPQIGNLIATLKSLYHQVPGMQGQPFEYSFLDDDFNQLYRAELRTGTLFTYFAFFAILIACMGLFGLIRYAAKQRTREIGIRKVLGAGVPGIVKLLSLDFMKRVLTAVLIALPLSWWASHKWLEGFAYRTEIKWWIYLAGALLAVLIALMTVCGQAFSTARANPVDSLRTE